MVDTMTTNEMEVMVGILIMTMSTQGVVEDRIILMTTMEIRIIRKKRPVVMLQGVEEAEEGEVVEVTKK